jgi:hypothetical protein
MELPHWLMAGGTLLLVVGFVGAALQLVQIAQITRPIRQILGALHR